MTSVHFLLSSSTCGLQPPLSLPLVHGPSDGLHPFFFSANPSSSRSTCNITELNCSGHRHRELSRCNSQTEPIAVICCGSGREKERGVASGAVMAGETVAAAMMESREEWSGRWAWQRRRRDG
ncbi:hypothetical protein M0R45_033069 [Rubus argutus]|uniref:Uncharacterized protein n=1 Tax=Rubus argutus TaxID=59490 RepID=A0AAW1WL55_RUBAR